MRPFAERITDLGFLSMESVVSFRSIAHLFGSTKSRCGIYLLVFHQEQTYIGQALNVVRRFAQHRRNYDNITGFSFIPVRQERLDETERKLIHRAEQFALTLLNTVHVSNVVGETDLDFVVSVIEQNAWLEAPELFNQREHIDPLILTDSQLQRFSCQFEKFKKHPFAPTALQLLRRYLYGCIPSPGRTEYSFWAVSCLPTTNRTTWPRLACINLGVMEAFVIGFTKVKPLELWGFVNVASDVLYGAFGNEDGFIKCFPSIELVRRNYRDAGQNQISLHAHDEASLKIIMESAAIRKAAAVLALRVMRKRATIYGKFHCKQLADYLLNVELV
jgi:hypothetical protein